MIIVRVSDEKAGHSGRRDPAGRQTRPAGRAEGWG